MQDKIVISNLIHFMEFIKREVYTAEIPENKKALVAKRMQDLAKQGYDLAKNGAITITIKED